MIRGCYHKFASMDCLCPRIHPHLHRLYGPWPAWILRGIHRLVRLVIYDIFGHTDDLRCMSSHTCHPRRFRCGNPFHHRKPLTKLHRYHLCNQIGYHRRQWRLLTYGHSLWHYNLSHRSNRNSLFGHRNAILNECICYQHIWTHE